MVGNCNFCGLCNSSVRHWYFILSKLKTLSDNAAALFKKHIEINVNVFVTNPKDLVRLYFDIANKKITPKRRKKK